MSKILITGGAGFIGFSLAKELHQRGHQVHLADNFARGRKDEEYTAFLDQSKCPCYDIDLTLRESYESLPKDFDYVYHLAAVVGVKNVRDNPDLVLKVNLLATINLFEWLKGQTQLKRILFASTSEVYAGTLKHFGIPLPTPEDTPLTIADIKDTRTTYALSKICGESIAFNYATVHNIPITAVRYHNVYGPRMGFLHVIPQMIEKLTQQKEIQVASPTHTRAFCYITDAVNATIAATESEHCRNEVYNIGNSDQELSIHQLVSTLAEVMGRDITIQELPDTPGSPARRCPDTSRLTQHCGFTPTVPLSEGLKHTYEWYKTRLDLRDE